MALLLGKLYDALIEAGATEKQADVSKPCNASLARLCSPSRSGLLAMSSGPRRGSEARLERRGRGEEGDGKVVGYDKRRAREPLGTRIRARFAEIGLEQDLPELRGEPARPATFKR